MRQLVRVGCLGHGRLVVQTLLPALEGSIHRVDGASGLMGDDAPGGEAAAVADAVDVVEHRLIPVAGAEKVGVDGMQSPFRVDGPESGGDTLGEDLAAEDMGMIGIVESAIQVLLDLLHVEEAQDLGQHGIHGQFSRTGPAPVTGGAMIPMGRVREHRRDWRSGALPRSMGPGINGNTGSTGSTAREHPRWDC